MNVTSDVARIPGWYGKLPSLGDFASRRLEADFIEPWDLWLGEGLQAQRAALGDGWLDAYNDTPPWRFLLAPGALRGVRPELAFAGVLVPSVDRVGRHFPFTVVASMAKPPGLPAEFDAVLAWLHRLEDMALDALQGDWTIDEVENELAGFGSPGEESSRAVEDRLTTVRRAVGDAMTRRGGFVDLAGVSSRSDLAAMFSGPTAAAPPTPRPPPMRGLALWIADTPGRSQLLVSDGLPARDDFVRMFSGGSGARAGNGARPAPVQVDDPMATLPGGLGPSFGAGAVAGAATAGFVDPLAMFGGAAPAPAAVSAAETAPRELLPDDDILGLYQVGPDSGASPLFPPSEVIPEGDAFALFAPAPARPSAAEPAPAGVPPGPPRDDDILAMFAATDSQADALAGEAPVKDELLGMFEVPPETPPFGESTAAPAPMPREGAPGEPDILDMFGIPPAKPEGKEAK